MTMGTALNTALAGLQVASASIDLTSRNITNASEPGYTRKTQSQTTDVTGAPVLTGVRREIDAGLLRNSRDAASDVGMLDAQKRYATQISQTFGVPGDATSLSTLTSSLGDAFQSLATRPEADVAYTEVVNTAQRVVSGIHGLYGQASQVAASAGSELSETIETANQEIALVDSLNKKIIASPNADTTDLQDQRDQAISSLADKLDITTFTRPDGGISVYTKSGTALVDVAASSLSSSQVAGTGPTQLVVQLDSGTVATASVRPRSGSIAGLLDVINTQVPNLRAQLDSFAGTLATSLSAAGVELFDDAGSTTYDPVATPSQTNGFGARIAVSGTIVATPQTIRDGTSATPLAPGDTTYIDAAAAVFQSTGLAFSGPGMTATNSLAGAASDIITGQSSREADYGSRLSAESTTKSAIDSLLSTRSGVNLDTEFSHLLQLQQAYAASARIVSAARSLFNTLLVASGGSAVG